MFSTIPIKQSFSYKLISTETDFTTRATGFLKTINHHFHPTQTKKEKNKISSKTLQTDKQENEAFLFCNLRVVENINGLVFCYGNDHVIVFFHVMSWKQLSCLENL